AGMPPGGALRDGAYRGRDLTAARSFRLRCARLKSPPGGMPAARPSRRRRSRLAPLLQTRIAACAAPTMRSLGWRWFRVQAGDGGVEFAFGEAGGDGVAGGEVGGAADEAAAGVLDDGVAADRK